MEILIHFFFILEILFFVMMQTILFHFLKDFLTFFWSAAEWNHHLEIVQTIGFANSFDSLAFEGKGC